MANNKIGDLRNHLFESIEMLKNNSDPDASPNEKMDVQTAKQISQLAGNLIDSYKVEVEAIQIMSKTDNPNKTTHLLSSSGIFEGIKELPEGGSK